MYDEINKTGKVHSCNSKTIRVRPRAVMLFLRVFGVNTEPKNPLAKHMMRFELT